MSSSYISSIPMTLIGATQPGKVGSLTVTIASSSSPSSVRVCITKPYSMG